MIRQVLLRRIDLWQRSTQRPRGTCIFEPTCSHYARQAIEERGVVLGVVLSAWRIARCNPYGNGGDDPVPRRAP